VVVATGKGAKKKMASASAVERNRSGRRRKNSLRDRDFKRNGSAWAGARNGRAGIGIVRRRTGVIWGGWWTGARR